MAKDAQTTRDEVFAKLAAFGLLNDQAELPTEPVKEEGVCKTASVSATGLADELDAFLKTAGADETGAFTEDSQTLQNDQGESQNAKHSTDSSTPDSHDAPLGAGDSEGGEGLDGGASDGLSQKVVDTDTGASQNATNDLGDGDTEARTLPADGVRKLAADVSSNVEESDGKSSIAKADLTNGLKEGLAPQDTTSDGKTGDETEAEGPTSNSIEGVGASTEDRTHQVEDEVKTAAADDEETDESSDEESDESSDEESEGDSEEEGDDKKLTLKLSKEAEALESSIVEAYLVAKTAALQNTLKAEESQAEGSVKEASAKPVGGFFDDILFSL